MNQVAKIGQPAPLVKCAEWVQGNPVNLDALTGHVVLIEVFQLNCPGCFIYSLPQSIDLFMRYHHQGLQLIGIATAFEDFDKNNLTNLQLLVNENRVIGETKRYFEQNNNLPNGKLPYQIPFPLAMDTLHQPTTNISDDDVKQFIDLHRPDFDQLPNNHQDQIKQLAFNHLQSRLWQAETFNLYNLQGTPSHIVIDKQGILKAVEFGEFTDLEWLISSLLKN